jgi:hypothetical protein
MLRYTRNKKFYFVETDYISDNLVILKDATYQKENSLFNIPPAHLFNIYQHDKLDSIGKVKFSIIDSVNSKLEGLIEFELNDYETNDFYAYHICMLLKQVARSYDIETMYLILPDQYQPLVEEKERLNASRYIEDGIIYRVIPVEKI